MLKNLFFAPPGAPRGATISAIFFAPPGAPMARRVAQKLKFLKCQKS